MPPPNSDSPAPGKSETSVRGESVAERSRAIPDTGVNSVASGKAVDIGELKKNAKRHMRKSACTLPTEDGQDYRFQPICGTSTRSLGRYGDGVELYFSFIFYTGVAFFLLMIVSGPLLAMNIMGNRVHESNAFYNFLSMLSVSNLGYCAGGTCLTDADLKNRIVYSRYPDIKVSDATEWLGLLDVIAMGVFGFFSLVFVYCILPRTVARNLKDHVTLSDYSLQVFGLPWKLAEGHDVYEAKLKTHFVEVLRKTGVEEADPVQDVVLVRDYSGGIARFMQMGDLLIQKEDAEVRVQHARALGKDADSTRCEKQVERVKAKIAKMEKNMKKIINKTELERGVCSAFVVFSNANHKARILNEYRYAQWMLFRCCQSQYLKFCNRSIMVDEAGEPSDIFWENVDFPGWQRHARKGVICFLTFWVMLFCTTLLVYAQSIQTVSVTESPTVTTWVVANAVGDQQACLDLCHIRFCTDSGCSSHVDDSTSWPIRSVFTSSGYLPEELAKSVLASGIQCDVQWKSAACASQIGADYIGFQFLSEYHVTAVQAWYPELRSLSSMELFACEDSIVPTPGVNTTNTSGYVAGTANFSKFSAEKDCTRMTDVESDGIPAETRNLSALSRSTGVQAVFRDTSCRYTVSLEEAMRAHGAAQDPSLDSTVNCFCKQQASTGTGVFDLPDVCEEWAIAKSLATGRTIGGIVLVLVINQCLLTIYNWMAIWERHPSLTDLTLSQMFKLFLAQFTNTGLLMLLVNWQLRSNTGWAEAIGLLQIGKGSYDDLSSMWFIVIGTGLLITIAVQTLSTTLLPLFSSFFLNPIKIYILSRDKLTQERIDAVYEYPAWNLALRLAQTLNVIFCVVMYSGGMPLLYSIGFVYCIMASFLDKLALLRGSSKPPGYHSDVIELAARMLPAAITLHCAIAMWTYGNQDVFPGEWSPITYIMEIILGITRDYAVKTEMFYKASSDVEKARMLRAFVTARVLDTTRNGAWLILLVFLVFIAYYIFELVMALLLRPLLSPILFVLSDICCICCKGRDLKQTQLDFKSGQEVIAKHGLLSSYSLAHSEKYKKAYLALKHQESRVQADAKAAGTAAV